MVVRLTAIVVMWLLSTAFGQPPPSGSVEPVLRVVEGRSVVLGSGTEVVLGSPVEHVPAAMSLEAYDPEVRSGLAQWRPDGTSTIIALIEDGTVVGVSMAFTGEVVSGAGVRVGDP